MLRLTLLSSSLAALLLVGTAACTASSDGTTTSDDELVDSRWVGTFRNNAARNGELRTIALKGDGTAAIVRQECTATACSSVQKTGKYTLGERMGNAERKLTIQIGAKKLAYRSRLEASSATVPTQGIVLLELDENGIEKQPFVTMRLGWSNDLWCAAPTDCALQSGARGPATDCVANTCVWGEGSVCKVKASETELKASIAVGQGAPSPRRKPAATWTGSGMFVFGGRAPDDTLLADGAIFDPATNTWTPVATTGAPAPREFAEAGAVDGKVVVAGGWNDGPGGGIFEDAYLYDIAANTWSSIPVSKSLAEDWIGDFYPAGGALYRYGFTRLLHKIDVKTGKVTPVTDPPEATAMRNAQGGIEGSLMHAVVGDSVVHLFPLQKAEGGWDHNIWRLFEFNGKTGKWTVADVGLGQIDNITSIAAAGNSLVLMNGKVAQGGGGTIATIDMPSKSVKITQIGDGNRTSTFGSVDLFGSAASPNPVALIRADDGEELDTLDVSRAWFAHQSSWSGTPPRRPRLPKQFESVRVWSGTELLVWGGRTEQTVDGFKVVSFPQNVVRYAPSECK